MNILGEKNKLQLKEKNKQKENKPWEAPSQIKDNVIYQKEHAEQSPLIWISKILK